MTAWLPISVLITAELMIWEDTRICRFVLDRPESTTDT